MNQRAGREVLSEGTPGPAQVGDIAPLRGATGNAAASLRMELRAATQDVHGRLHHHAGFAAVQDSTICLARYQALIVRLYGFYVPFEAAMAIEPERSNWLADDLVALGYKRPLHTLPMCRHIPHLDSAFLRLGALYVAEGSALGGRELARGLDRLIGADVAEGRKFFIGRGAGTGHAWRAYLALLSVGQAELSACAEIIKGAVKTFAAFENWINGWNTSSYD